MSGKYFYFEIPPVESCGRFPPNFCSKFSEHLFYQLPNILSKSPNIWSKFPEQKMVECCSLFNLKKCQKINCSFRCSGRKKCLKN